LSRTLELSVEQALEVRARHEVVVRAVAVEELERGLGPRDPGSQPGPLAGRHRRPSGRGPGGQHRVAVPMFVAAGTR